MDLYKACKPRKSVFDKSRRDVVWDLSDFLNGKLDRRADEFFAENYVTSGMRTLIEKTFDRFAGIRDQASTFVLTQAMGGGKTHNMIALGFLAHFQELRQKVFKKDWAGTKVGRIRVVGFDGRNSDAPFGLWGEIADQLGKKETFKELYSPLKAPGVTSWINLLKGDPTLILLDELPPYLENAETIQVGAKNLAVATTTAVSNLIIAANKEELANVCVIISDLSATAYHVGGGYISEALQNLENETNRSALRIEPVSTQGDEVYYILRKRLFESLPDDKTKKQIANEYAKAVRVAKQMDITSASPDSYAAQLADSYPFHFSIRDLYGRFKANPGFQQTRGLIRLMRIIVSNLWKSGQAKEIQLIHPYDIDLNDDELFSEFKTINSSLDEAIRNDIANGGKSLSEQFDERRGGKDAQDVCKLILVASLANIPGATHGLRDTEIIGYLCAPGRDISAVKTEVLDVLPTNVWYLHRSTDGRLFFKNVQNLVAKLHSLSQSYPREAAIKELRTYIRELFEPHLKDVYQKLEVIPALDDVDIDQDRVTLIVSEPTANPIEDSKLSSTWYSYARNIEYKNRVLFLTGDQDTLQRVIDNAAQYKAIQAIIADLDSEQIPPLDPQHKEADQSRDQITLRLRSALEHTFTIIIYPSKDRLRHVDFRMQFTNNNFDGEALIRAALEKVQKFTSDTDSETFLKKIEGRLFAGQGRARWTEIRRRAATNVEWQLHQPKSLEEAKDRALKQERWRDEGGIIDKGPFPAKKTSVLISRNSRKSNTGEVSLRIEPLYGSQVRYEVGNREATPTSLVVSDYGSFHTLEVRLSFLCEDSTGEHPAGEPVVWKNEINVKHRGYQQGDVWMLELKAIPKGAIRYTTDGSDPHSHGMSYDAPFPIPDECRYILAVAEQDSVDSEIEKIDAEEIRTKTVKVDPNKPAIWVRQLSNKINDEAWKVIERLEKFKAKANGVVIRLQCDGREITYMTSESISMGGEELRTAVNQLEKVLDFAIGGKFLLNIDSRSFERGQDVLDWVADEKTSLKPGEVRQ